MPQKKKSAQKKKQPNSKQVALVKSSSTPVRDLVTTVMKSMAPLIAKGSLGFARGIPFPASGMAAQATPSSGMGMSVSAPIANGNVIGVSKASIANTGSGIRVRHKEYITDVVHATPGIFETLLYENVNPTNSRLFPWLSSIAPRFETFRFNALKFIYEPQCATSSEGTVMLAVDYDAADDPPSDKTELMSYKGAVRSPAWFACCNSSASSDLRKSPNYYTRSASNTDTRITNVGKLILAFQGESSGFTAGELYVEYDLQLDTPQLQQDSPALYLEFNQGVFPSSSVFPSVYKNIGSLPVMFDQSTGTPFLIFEKAGTYLLNLLATSLTGGTPSSTVSLGYDAVVPGGSLAKLSALHGGNLLLSGTTTYTSAQASPSGVYEVFIPNPGEMIEIALGATPSVPSGLGNYALKIIVSEIETLLGKDQGVTPKPQVHSSVSRALRLMDKRVRLQKEEEPPRYSSHSLYCSSNSLKCH